MNPPTRSLINPQYHGCLVHQPLQTNPWVMLQPLGLADLCDAIVVQPIAPHSTLFTLRTEVANAWMPEYDTLNLCHTHPPPPDLLREIVVSMLIAPIALEFPSAEEFISAVRIRANTVHAARKTGLDFDTTAIERPMDCWVYRPSVGFAIRSGCSLIEGLRKATQPDASGKRFSFSCYRASEYVILLGIAQELEHCNPTLYTALEKLWEANPIQSGRFHDVFLHEQGSMEQPLPLHYFVPGDRTWFRNPDAASAEASGFEGSWVVYLGGGLFSNFWKPEAPFTLEDKCLEIYHWRDGLYLDAEGEERINETQVAECVAATRKNPSEMQRIMTLMARYREGRGIYTEAGGCIDTTREFARWVRPNTSDMRLPTQPL